MRLGTLMNTLDLFFSKLAKDFPLNFVTIGYMEIRYRHNNLKQPPNSKIYSCCAQPIFELFHKKLISSIKTRLAEIVVTLKEAFIYGVLTEKKLKVLQPLRPE